MPVIGASGYLADMDPLFVLLVGLAGIALGVGFRKLRPLVSAGAGVLVALGIICSTFAVIDAAPVLAVAWAVVAVTSAVVFALAIAHARRDEVAAG